MAILSLFAITLLSAHAFELPSTSETMREIQRRFGPLKAEVATSLKEVVAPVSRGVQKLAVSESSLHASPMAKPSSPHVLQNAEACYAAMMLPCFAGIGVVGSAMEAENATAAVTLFEGYCTNCTDPAAEFANVTTSCNITDEADLETYNNMADLFANACDDTTCAGNVLWSFTAIQERRDSFCPNAECGLPIIEPLISDTLVNATGDNCLANNVQLFCLDDDDDNSVYCVDLFEEGMEDDSVADLCESSCAEDLSIVYEALLDEECGLVEPLNVCDNPDIESFTLIDFCTVDEDGELCYDLLLDDDTNMTACGDVFDLVPAPGADGIVAPTECPAACATQLQTFVDTVKCCAGFALELSCSDPVIGTFIEATCDVSYETCERPTPVPEPETTGVASIVVTFASIFLPAALSMLM